MRRDFGQWQGSCPGDNELARRKFRDRGGKREGFTDSAFSDPLGSNDTSALLPSSLFFSARFRSFVCLHGRVAQRCNFGTRLVCRAETAPDLAGHEPVGCRRGGEFRGMGSPREKEKERERERQEGETGITCL